MEEGKVDPKIGSQITKEINDWLEQVNQEFVIVPSRPGDTFFDTWIQINSTTPHSSTTAIYATVSFTLFFEGDVSVPRMLISLPYAKKIVELELFFRKKLQKIVERWINNFEVIYNSQNVRLEKVHGAECRGQIKVFITISLLGPDGKKIPPAF
jgi:hypothetical protein